MPKDKTPLILKFNMDSETPNTIRFEEEGDRATRIVGKVYVQKTQLKKWGDPRQLTVTVTPS